MTQQEEVLAYFKRNKGKPMSRSDVANGMGLKYGQVSLQVKKLYKYGFIRLAHVEKVNSYKARYYVYNENI